MTSQPIRDPVSDYLLTPKNAALVLIDYQPVQVHSVASMDRQLLINNVVGLAKTALAYGLPIVLSTVNVKTGLNNETIPQLRKVLSDVPSIDRTSINSWEDVEFVEAVKATGRKKLIMVALWTEVCLTFPSLDALRESYEVFPVVCFDEALGEFMLPYEAVRTADAPEESLMEFLQSTYEAAANAGPWERAALECPLGSLGVPPARA